MEYVLPNYFYLEREPDVLPKSDFFLYF